MTATTDVGAAVLAADDLILGPRLTQLAATVRATAPGWLLDQLDAATDQVTAGFHHAAAAGRVHLQCSPAAEHPGWVRLGALHALVSWTAGTATTCMHAPALHRPQPVSGAAWKPDLIVCAACTHLLAVRRGDVVDRTCDGCGHITTGTANGDGVYPGTVQLGPLMWSFGCCERCRYWRTADEHTARHRR